MLVQLHLHLSSHVGWQRLSLAGSRQTSVYSKKITFLCYVSVDLDSDSSLVIVKYQNGVSGTGPALCDTLSSDLHVSVSTIWTQGHKSKFAIQKKKKMADLIAMCKEYTQQKA